MGSAKIADYNDNTNCLKERDDENIIMLKADSIQNFIPKKDCFIGDLQLKCSVYRGLTTAFYLLRLAPFSPFEASKILTYCKKIPQS